MTARTEAEWQQRVDAIEDAPAAEESFDATAALRRVMALADEIGARPPASQFVHVNAIRQAIRGTL